MDIAAQTGVQISIHFETPHFDDANDVIAQLRAFYARRLNHPAMLKYGGQPVIFLEPES